MASAEQQQPARHRRNTSNSSIDELESLKDQIKSYVDAGDREGLHALFENEETGEDVLQCLLTMMEDNIDGFYHHDADVLNDANLLLGQSIIQICIFLGEEDIAIDILNFLNMMAIKTDSRKVLLEFVGRVWGEGNTALHLASFYGMSELVKRLLELGAYPSKRNRQQYTAIDCADDVTTVDMFGKTYDEHLALLPRPPPPDLTMRTINSFDDFHLTKPRSASTSTPPGGEKDGSSGTRRRAYSHSRTLQVDKPVLLRPRKSSFLVRNPQADKGNKKTVKFDTEASIFYMCQFGDMLDQEAWTSFKQLASSQPNLSHLRTGGQSLTPLHLACSYNQPLIVNFLVGECGVAVNVVDNEGWTPLHSACVEGYTEIVDILAKCQGRKDAPIKDNADWFYVEDGPIDLEPLNYENETPEDLARDKDDMAIVQKLKAWIQKYPQQPKPARNEEVLTGSAEDSEEEGEEDESDDESSDTNDVPPKEHKVNPRRMDISESIRMSNSILDSPIKATLERRHSNDKRMGAFSSDKSKLQATVTVAQQEKKPLQSAMKKVPTQFPEHQLPEERIDTGIKVSNSIQEEDEKPTVAVLASPSVFAKLDDAKDSLTDLHLKHSLKGSKDALQVRGSKDALSLKGSKDALIFRASRDAIQKELGSSRDALSLIKDEAHETGKIVSISPDASQDQLPAVPPQPSSLQSAPVVNGSQEKDETVVAQQNSTSSTQPELKTEQKRRERSTISEGSKAETPLSNMTRKTTVALASPSQTPPLQSQEREEPETLSFKDRLKRFQSGR